jgi:hypothetical protein
MVGWLPNEDFFPLPVWVFFTGFVQEKARKKKKKMSDGFHMARAAHHRAHGRHDRARRHEASASAFGTGLADMPAHVLLRILEMTDFNLDLFLVSARLGQLDRTTTAMHVARRLILCTQPQRQPTRASLQWLPSAYLELNVHRIIEIVVRCTAARHAILSIARTPRDRAHDALLVRAPFFRKLALMHDERVTQAMRGGADELFHAMRPSIEAAIRSERIGDTYLYKDVPEARMDELVGRIGRNPLIDHYDLAGAVVGYMRNHTGLGPSRLFDNMENGLEGLDEYATHEEAYGPLCFWDTSGVDSCSGLFSHVAAHEMAIGEQDGMDEDDTVTLPALAEFSADIFWPTQNVRDLSYMFANSNFNGRIGHLNTFNVTHFGRMFYNNPVFNQPLDGWDVTNAWIWSEMFRDARSFNQPLTKWRTERIPFTDCMFMGAVSFNKPLGPWRVSITRGMFRDALSFNQPLDTLDVSRVRNCIRMFQNTPSFNQPLHVPLPRYNGHFRSMFLDSAFSHPVGWIPHGEEAPDRGRRMRHGPIDAASLVPAPRRGMAALGAAGPLVPAGWYDANTVAFDRTWS